MKSPFALLRAIGRGVLNAVGGGVLGEVVVDLLPDVARDAWDWWKKDRTPEQRRAEIEALAQAPAPEIREQIEETVAAVASDRPPEVQLALSLYLSQVPAAVRQSLRRPSDPSGLSVPPLLALNEPDDLLPLLPAQLPRFQPGDRPLPGIDWELVELLGIGGFGEVWKARNPHFDAVPPVALKFCLDAAARDRLLRHEAAILNQVMRQGKHPGIVALQHTYLSADPPCLEYEFIPGGDLASLIQEWHRGPAGRDVVEKANRLLLDLARIVAFAHRLDPPIVHRDLKPANILVQQAPDGKLSLRVADFGIGGVAASQAIARTRLSVSQGQFLVTALRGAHTPLYASPQQMRGAAPDPRDDVYALGVIWYQMLTGNLVGGRPGGTRWVKRLADMGMSSALVDLLGSCVEEAPADRPAHAGELAEQLTSLLGERPAPAPTPARTVQLPRVLTNAVGMKLVLVPAGTFLMGSPDGETQRCPDEAQHRVTITRPFYVGVHPVTQREYEAVMRTNPSHFTASCGGGPNHPVEQVSWLDAVEFCRKLSALTAEKAADRTYALPTEAEWEYACRAGTTRPFCCGDALSSEQANFDGNHPFGGAKRGGHLQRTSAVGSYGANAWGLHDMHGNVWEWCLDWYDENWFVLGPANDPQGPLTGDHRVLRGGCWNNSGHLCRSARRNKYAASFRNDTIGFRVVVHPGQ
jgi:formylglycine-generating enzyme required for sulfatase activity